MEETPAKSHGKTSWPQGRLHGSLTLSLRTTLWEHREDTFPSPWIVLIIVDIKSEELNQRAKSLLRNDIDSKFIILSSFHFARCWSRLRKCNFAPQPSILRWPHEGTGLCQEAELDQPAGTLGELSCLCLRMWKKPGTGPRSASQNYITIIPLSVSEASWAPAQSGRKVGEGWQWVGLY